MIHRSLVVCFVVIAVGSLAASTARAEKIVLFAGGGTDKDNAPATQCKLGSPFGIDFDRAGNAFLIEYAGLRLLKVDPQGKLIVAAGTGEKGFSGNDGPALKATFNTPHSLLVLPGGGVLIADTNNNCVRKYNPATGNVAAFAGTGEKGFSGDGGPAVKAQFGGVYSVSLDVKGNRLLLDDLDNRRIRAIDLTSGLVSTVAGNGKTGVPADGANAADSPLADPRAVAADQNGNVYILERSGNALRVVDGAGKIRTVVGTGAAGNTGDDGDALRATLKGPKHLCVDQNGDVLIADTDNHVIRRYSPVTGKITRVAGTGKMGTGKLDAGGVGGDPLKCELNQPHGVAVDSHGVLYIVDSHNDRVLKIEKEK